MPNLAGAAWALACAAGVAGQGAAGHGAAGPLEVSAPSSTSSASSASSASPPLHCRVAVVGGGWAGVYAAWRLAVDSGVVAAADVCLFEGGKRAGGRTYSVPVSGLIVDVGAYRFAKEMHLPADIIIHKLSLPIQCYEPSCDPDAEFNATLYKIVDENGNAAGYGTPIHTLTAQLVEAGAAVLYEHELVAISGPESNRTLTFKNGVSVTAGQTLLNLPRPSVKKLDAPALFSDEKTAKVLGCEPCPTDNAEPIMQLKVYVVYPQPWWLTDLGIEHGLFTSVETNPPFVGRYHDGPISRTVSIDGDVSVGQAALEVVYTFSLQYESIDYYSQFREFYKHFVGSEYKGNATAVDPLTVSEDSALLEAVHGKLMAMHVDLFEQKGKSASDVGMPTSVVFGFWDLDESTLLPTPLSSNFAAQFPTCQVETCLDSISPHDYFTTTAFPAEDLYIANNDFYYTLYQDTPCCWAQQSLKVAERILHDKFGAPQPSWLDGEYYETAVMAL